MKLRQEDVYKRQDKHRPLICGGCLISVIRYPAACVSFCGCLPGIRFDIRFGNRRYGIQINLGNLLCLIQPDRKKTGAEPGFFCYYIRIDKPVRPCRTLGRPEGGKFPAVGSDRIRQRIPVSYTNLDVYKRPI